MNKISIEKLEAKTNEFFSKHYNEKELQLPVPKWQKWDLVGKRTVNEEPGCYAMVFENEGEELVEYIGIGISQNGVGSRINIYHTVDYKEGNLTIYKPIEKFAGLKAFYIIGFDKKVKYLIPALESFLISELNPSRNKIGKII